MGSVAKLKFKEAKETLLKIDIGSWDGRKAPEGFVPLKSIEKRWPFKDASVDEAECNYLLHLLTMPERIHFANELYRVLKSGGKCLIHTPHWCAAKAYGHPNAVWPPVSEYFYPMLNKRYRETQRNHESLGLTCDFENSIGYGMHPSVSVRHAERQQEQVMWDKEAAQDLICTLIKP